MNKKALIAFEAKNRRLFDFYDRMKLNCVRVNPANSFAHEFAKFKACYELVRSGHKFLTEARFLDRRLGRCDIVDLTSGEVIEIVASESEASLQEKKAKYPLPIKVVKIDSSSECRL